VKVTPVDISVNGSLSDHFTSIYKTYLPNTRAWTGNATFQTAHIMRKILTQTD
jgi:hypothetical protein